MLLGSMQVLGGQVAVAEEMQQAALLSQEPAEPRLGTAIPSSTEHGLWPKLPQA